MSVIASPSVKDVLLEALRGWDATVRRVRRAYVRVRTAQAHDERVA